MPLIAFASPKGGVGKTTVTAHMAALFARRGRRVIAIDLDPQNALRLHLGVPMREEGGFVTSLREGRPWRECLLPTRFGVEMLPFGAADPLRVMELSHELLTQPARIADPVREMLAEPDTIVVVDSPPGPSGPLAALTPLVDLMVLVLLADGGSAAIIPHVAGNRFLGRGTLASRMADRAVVVLNQLDEAEPLSDAVWNMAQQALGKRLVGAVCRDQAIAEALADKRLLLEEDAGAAEDLQVLADTLLRLLPEPRQDKPRGGRNFSALNDWGG
ncbi:cellulose synthase operon protein YhjQ/BcsQ [Roseococcus sp. YIM B11640]|uniref:cellulose synthase operon protein YhjQ/BcsQ n=1 Tax=Roseococcus sp. YIM B11640 TaxID=3133973 RepID=UPI003C7CEB28